MAVDLWLAFVVASMLVTLLPGPSMLLVIADALRRGQTRALVTAAGVVCADAILLVLSLLGVGAVLAASAAAFTAMKWAGAAVLVWLGLRQWWCAGAPSTAAEAPGPGHAGLFAKGFAVTMLNPKIIGFFVAFFPQFVDPAAPALPQLAILGATFLTVVFAVLAAYAGAAGAAAHALRRPETKRLLDRASGGTLIAAGGMAALMRRPD